MFSVSDRICTVAEAPLPTTHDRFGVLAQRLAEHVLDLLGGDGAVAPAAGIDTLVPPSKSMPKVKPRSTMLAMQTATIKPLIAYHSLRRPMTSNAPVPV